MNENQLEMYHQLNPENFLKSINQSKISREILFSLREDIRDVEDEVKRYNEKMNERHKENNGREYPTFRVSHTKLRVGDPLPRILQRMYFNELKEFEDFKEYKRKFRSTQRKNGFKTKIARDLMILKKNL